MTARQIRRAQQKAERKARKLDLRHNTLAETTIEPLAETVEASCASVSEAKLAANRANAERSTGPISDAGKAISSQNRTRHGLSGSKFRVLPGESQADFNELLARLLEEHAPEDQTETEFVHQLAEALWLGRRAMRLQDACILAIESDDSETSATARKDLTLYLRYQTTHDRTVSRCLTELRKCRNERRRVERGFESQKLRAAQEVRKQEAHQIRQAIEKRKEERHQLSLLAAETKLGRKQQPPTVSESKPESIRVARVPASKAAA